MTPEQCREARALIGWSKRDLAEAAVISLSTLNRFERSGIIPNSGLLADIKQAFVASGVEFIPETEGNPGVRLMES